MKFTFRIPGRDEIGPALSANSANPLIVAGVHHGATAAANDDVLAVADQAPISGLAGLATSARSEVVREAKVERSAIINTDGVPSWETDGMSGLPTRTGAEIVSFEKRVARITWLGYAEAKGLVEKLLRRDRDGDDRRLCVECSHAGPGWRCAKREVFLLDQLQRCPLFKEKLP